MKTESINPWAIIRWGIAATAYAGTIAIAVDQVKTKDKELVETSRALASTKKELRAAVAKRDELQSSTLEWMGRANDIGKKGQDLAAAYQRVIDARKAEADARAARDAQIIAGQAASPTTAASIVRPYYPVSAAAATSPIIPAWSPPAPSAVTKAIRDAAVAEHKDNYSSLNYEIERQTAAYEKVLRYYKTADPFIKTAINKAALEYGSNYSSLAYDVERQIEAKQKFDRK